MDVKHTPGPWTISQPWSGFSTIYGADGKMLFGLAAGSEDEKRADEVCEANAALIAAAPELLVACELAVAAMGNMDAAKVVRAAIARATTP